MVFQHLSDIFRTIFLGDIDDGYDKIGEVISPEATVGEGLAEAAANGAVSGVWGVLGEIFLGSL